MAGSSWARESARDECRVSGVRFSVSIVPVRMPMISSSKRTRFWIVCAFNQWCIRRYASAGFAGGASREVKETDIFLATQTSITFLDVSADGIGAGDLLGDQAAQRKVLAQRSEVLDDAIKQLDRLSVSSKFVNRIQKPALPSTLVTRSLDTFITSSTSVSLGRHALRCLLS